MINSAVMNIGVHVSLSDLVSLVCMPRSGIAGSLNLLVFESLIKFKFFYHSISSEKFRAPVNPDKS